MADVIARLSVILGLDTAAFEKGADVSEKRLKRMEREFERSGKELQKLGKKLTLAISAPIAAAGAAVIKMSGDFESSMIKLGISSEASASELKEMGELALKLGKDTIFGASDAANAMDELAKSGLSARIILDGAAEAAVHLASATGSELSPAANAITDTMQQFHLATSQLPDAVNQITGAVNQSKLDFEDYALAIGQAGGVAGGLGVDFTDFNTVLAATSSLFASGSDAGTSFKTFLTSLSGNSKQAKAAIAAFGLQFYDANGGLRSMAEIAEELRVKLGGLNDQAKTEVLKKIFGTDAMRTAIGLMQQGGAGLERMADAIRKTDAAAQAQERLKGFYGQLENLKGAIETLAIRIGQSGVLEAITALITRLGDFVDTLSETSPAVLKFVAVVAAIAAAIGPVVLTIGILKSALAPLWVALKLGLPSLTLLKLELAALAVAGGPAAVAMRLLALALRGLLIATGVGAAIAALAGIIYIAGRRAREAGQTSEAYAKALKESNPQTSKAAELAQKLASAHEQVRKKALAAAKAEQQNAAAKLASARASVILAQAEVQRLAVAIAEKKRRPSVASMDPRFSRLAPEAGLEGALDSAVSDMVAAQKTAENWDRRLREISDLIDNAAPPPVANVSEESGGGRQARADDPKERAYREAQELRSLQIEELQAREQLAATASERAEFQRQILALEREGRIAEINEAVRKKEMTADEAKARMAIFDTLYGQAVTEDETGDLIVQKQKSLYGELQTREELREAEQDRATVARAQYEIERDALDHAYDFALTQGERRDLALQMLDLEYRHQRAILDGILATEAVGSARWQEAKLLRDALDAQFANRRAAAMRDTESPMERYRREINLTAAQMSEAFEEIRVSGLQSLNDQLADAIVNFKSLGDVAKNVFKQMLADILRLQIQKHLIAPLANFLGNMGGGSNSIVAGDDSLAKIGAGLGSIFKNLPKFALGTNFAPGGLALVGERGPELVDLPRGARVTPNNQLGGRFGGIAQIVPSPYFDVVVDGRVYSAAPGIASAGAAGGVAQMRRAGSRRLAS
ncbi:MAG TPA: phage tail tape measure protein [Sphingopyxis sp.]|nr:phage tail tape measure protein [Sphingopyxis sp.]